MKASFSAVNFIQWEGRRTMDSRASNFNDSTGEY